MITCCLHLFFGNFVSLISIKFRRMSSKPKPSERPSRRGCRRSPLSLSTRSRNRPKYSNEGLSRTQSPTGGTRTYNSFKTNAITIKQPQTKKKKGGNEFAYCPPPPPPSRRFPGATDTTDMQMSRPPASFAYTSGQGKMIIKNEREKRTTGHLFHVVGPVICVRPVNGCCCSTTKRKKKKN